MAAGDLTCSTPVLCTTPAAIVAAVNALNLAAVTDFLFVIPDTNLSEGYWVFKVLRAAV
jgi:hypothetical protein